jgi:DNA-binding transcriptional MerR regulator
MDEGLLPIGRFSWMTRLSVKALRHYAEQGLLVPAWTDPVSGYRYYRSGQANRAEAIRVLRRVDMPLDEIRVVLADDDPDSVGRRLAAHRERLERRLADEQRMLRFLQRLIDRGGQVMPYDVSIKQVPTRYVVSWTAHTSLRTIGDVVGRGFGTVAGALGASGATPDGPPFVIYHDVIDEQVEGRIEVCIPVSSKAEGVVAGDVGGGGVGAADAGGHEPDAENPGTENPGVEIPGTENPGARETGAGETGEREARVGNSGFPDAGTGVEWKELPGGIVAWTTHHGPYDEISPAYHTLAGWIQEHGHGIVGAPREIYLTDPRTTAPDDLLTEVQFPVDDPA